MHGVALRIYFGKTIQSYSKRCLKAPQDLHDLLKVLPIQTSVHSLAFVSLLPYICSTLNISALAGHRHTYIQYTVKPRQERAAAATALSNQNRGYAQPQKSLKKLTADYF